jgi:hypothetical protein
MDRINILDIIKKSKKYDIALFTTFNFEIGFFERNISNKLFDNGTRKVSLFVDSKEYIKSLEGIEFSYIGKRYMVTPVEMNSSFHPKVILLLGENKARLIVGSCNLTTSGYYINNEIGNSFDYDEGNLENLSLIQDTMNFFLSINDRTDKRDNALIESIKMYPYYRYKNNEDINTKFIQNIDTSIINQVKEYISDKVNEIDIAVPYYDKEITGLKILQSAYPDCKFRLFIQNERNTFPIEFKDNYEINIYNKFIDNDSYHFYHGKVIRFITENNSYILYGSANCTQAALTKSTANGGNIECDFISKGSIDEYNYFFDNFYIENEIEFKSDLLNIESANDYNFMFLNNNINILKFKCKKVIDNLTIKILDNKLKYEYLDNELTIYIPIELLNNLNGVFVVEFYYDNSIEKANCYFNDYEQIEHNRNQEIMNKIPDINVTPDIDAEPNKYLKDRLELITKFGFMYDIFNEKLDYYVKDNESEDSEITDEREDFIDYDFKLSDEVQLKKKTLDQILKANQHIFHSFRERLLTFKRSNNNENYNNNLPERKYDNVVVQCVPRSATSDEKSFARTVKNIAKDMLNKTNSNKLDFSNYIMCVVSIFDTFNKYIIREKVIDMFNEKDVINIQYNLIQELSSKFEYEILDEEKEMFLWLSLACILQINYLNVTSDKVDYKMNLSNRNLLKVINEKFNIRDNYSDYLDISLAFINEDGHRIDETIAKSYIESLFEYKTHNQVEELMNKNFGNDYTIEMIEPILLIKINANNIGDYFNLNDPLIKEIIKSYSTDDNFKALKIEILNVNMNPNYPNPPLKIEYMFNRSGNGQQTVYPKIGDSKIKTYNIR